MTAVLVALIGLLAASITGAVQFARMRTENRTQHAAGQDANEARWETVMMAIGHTTGVVEVTREEQADGFGKVDVRLDGLDGRVIHLEEGHKAIVHGQATAADLAVTTAAELADGKPTE